ncbi:hypothetical protein [Nocardioides zeicaulis]|uniref:Sensor domain-containing protein n=2 Tax=Nocardioides zeicaulis TaxID=1776857 RepID=A0ABV6E664_9ACTN
MRRPTPSSAPWSAPLAVLVTLVLAGCAGTPRPAAPADPAPSPTSAAAVDRVETAGRIPNDFPLTSGWRAGLKAPRRGNADLPLCGDGSGDPPNANATDRLAARWAKRARTRQVTLYPDGAAARQAVGALLAYYRGCPVAGWGELPWRSTTTVRPTGTGTPGESRWQVVQALADADGVFGGSVVQVVRVGRAVLLDVAGATVDGRWTARARAIAADQVTWGAAVVEAMDGL